MGFDERTPRVGGFDPVPAPAGCDEWGHAASLYADGELGEADRSGFEAHIESCPGCRHAAQFARSFRRSLRSAEIRTPTHLRARVIDALDEQGPPAHAALALLRRLWSPMPVAAAGATALGLTALLWSGGSADDVVRELVAHHSRRLPLEFKSSDPQSIQAWLQDKVDFHMTVPRPVGLPLSLMGVRLWNVHNHEAVYLVYSTLRSPSHRVSMLVYDDPSGRLPSEGVPHRIDDHDVYMANRAGFNVAVWKKDEVVYSLVSDSPDDVARMVQATDQR